MKAAIYSETKSGKVLELRDVEQPVPQDSEVLLRVRAASVNPLDWRLKSEHPGVDVAGEVIGIGRKVTKFKPGDAVFGAGKGAFAEYVCALETKIAAKPGKVSYEQAASIPIAGLTALQVIRDKGHLRAGQKILINGAAGGVGTFAMQIAKAYGADVTGVCSTANIDLVRSLGANRVVDYTREDFAENSERYDLVLDNVGNRSLSSIRRVLKPKGKCIMAGAPKQLWAVLLRILKAFLWQRRFKFFIANINQNDLNTIGRMIEAGTLRPVIDKCYPLTQAADAIAYVETGHARAKVIITCQPD